MTASEAPIGSVLISKAIEYGTGFVLPAGQYDVHHMSPWGPVLYETNSLGCRLIIRDKQVDRWV